MSLSNLEVLKQSIQYPTNIYGSEVFLLTTIKPEYSDILYNPTHFLGTLVCQIRQVPLYINLLFNDH